MSRQIRPAEAADAPFLSAIARDAKASWGYSEEWLDAWAPQLTISPSYIKRHLVLVFLEHGIALGFVSLESLLDTGEVGHLWVHPGHQGRGIGNHLMAAALDRARQAGCRELLVLSDPNAVGFYEKHGAIQVGEEDAPVLGEDRVLPRLSIPLE